MGEIRVQGKRGVWASQPGWVMELGEARMDRVGVVCRIGVLGSKVFPAEASGNIYLILSQLVILILLKNSISELKIKLKEIKTIMK